MSNAQTDQSTPSDESLCELIANGDRFAEETMVNRYSRLVRICTRPYFLAGGDNEDLIQEGMVGLLYAMREFNPLRGASFRSFAETCIRNRIRSAVRAASRDKHSPLNQAISLEFPLLDGNTDGYPIDVSQTHQKSPEDLLISREDRQERLGALKGQLSGFEDKILQFYLCGLSYDEIAKATNRTTKAVDNAVQRIRRKVAQHFSTGDISKS